MSITSNAQFKIAENAAEMLALLQGMGIDTSAVETKPPKAQAQAEIVKLCRKRWQQRNPAKCREYRRKFMTTDKGQALRERNAEKERTPEKRAKRKTYRDRPEVKECRRVYAAAYYANAENKERKREQNRQRYAENKEAINAQHREYYAINKEKVLARTNAYYTANKAQLNAKAREKYAANREKEAERKRRAYYAKKLRQ